MKSALLVLGITIVSLVLALPSAQSLLAAPMSGTVNVAVGTGGKLQPAAGGTGATLNHIYVPARVTVKVGTTVVWTNKHAIPEPHTVTFLEPNMQTGELKGGPPFLFSRPKAGKEGSKNPADMEWLLHEQYVLPNDVSGAKFRNSGFLFPAKMGPPDSASSWKYTFTEMDAGKTVKYACSLHPWMTGSVVVVK